VLTFENFFSISVSVQIDINLRRSCQPLLKIGPLTAVCVENLTSIAMSAGSNFTGKFSTEDSYASFFVTSDLSAGVHLIAFEVINPMDAQEAPVLVMEMKNQADVVSKPAKQSISACKSDLFSPSCPEFRERFVRQSSKYAGDWSNITISLYKSKHVRCNIL